MFWNRFFYLCTTNNTTPNAVCAKLGLSTATATHWKNGSIPKGDALLKIADYFNVSIDYLLGRDDSLGTLEIRRKVKEIAEVYNLPIKVIENTLGTNYATFQAWCNGYGDFFDNIATFSKISQLFDVPIDYLLGREVPAQHENLSSGNTELINKYTALTPEAQQKVNAYIDDLMDNPKYAQNALARYKAAMKNKGQIAAFGGDGVQSVDTPNVSPEHIKDLIKETKKTNNS